MTDYERMLEEIRALGMDYKWSRMFVKKFADDEKAFSVSEEERKWAMEKGFFPGRIELYGLNEDNWRDFVSDYKYFMLHPMNNHSALDYAQVLSGPALKKEEGRIFFANKGLEKFDGKDFYQAYLKSQVK